MHKSSLFPHQPQIRNIAKSVTIASRVSPQLHAGRVYVFMRNYAEF